MPPHLALWHIIIIIIMIIIIIIIIIIITTISRVYPRSPPVPTARGHP